MLGGTHILYAVQRDQPMHYWQDWIHLFDSAESPHLVTGTAAQHGAIAVGLGVAAVVLARRDPAA
jgi:ABC-2 type transport system permease protein